MFFLIIILQKKKHLLDLLQIYQFLPYQKKNNNWFLHKRKYFGQQNVYFSNMSFCQNPRLEGKFNFLRTNYFQKPVYLSVV